MTAHHHTGFGPEMTQDDFDAIGREELAQFWAGHIRASRNADDPAMVQKWFYGRDGLDQETRRLILTILFPKKTHKARAVTSPRLASFSGVAANHA